MKLFDVLKNENIVENNKDYNELIWNRSIKINGYIITDPEYIVQENYEKINITVGIKEHELL